MGEELEDDWAEKELAKQTADRPLRGLVHGPLYHATKGIAGIKADRAIRPFVDIRRGDKNAAAGFGHSGIVSGENHVSLTTSEERGRAYFDVLVALAAIAEQRVAVEQWFEWYLRRWGSPDDLLKDAATKFIDEEFPGELATAFEPLKVETAWQEPADIRRNALAALKGFGVVQRLEWLFGLDQRLMHVSDNQQDRGLGVVNEDAKAWSSLRVSAVALLKVKLPDDAIGYPHEDEEEVRVRGIILDFEVIDSGETRFSTFPW